jgi:hypothetical protein
MKLLSDGERSFTAKYDESIDPQNIEIRKGFPDRHFGKNSLAVDHLNEASAISRSEDRPAAWQYSADGFCSEVHGMRFPENSFEAVFDPDALHPILADRRANHRTYHCVQSGCVTAASQYPYLLIHTTSYSPYEQNISLLNQN